MVAGLVLAGEVAVVVVVVVVVVAGAVEVDVVVVGVVVVGSVEVESVVHDTELFLPLILLIFSCNIVKKSF